MTYLSRLSLKNRSIVALATIAVIAFGIYAATALKQELIPSLTLPAVTVVSTYQGASPEIVDSDVTEPIESAVGSGEGQAGMTSYSNEGSSIVQIEYDYGTDTDAAVQDLQQQVNRIQSQLPDDVSTTVSAGRSEDLPIITLAAGSSQDEQKLAEDLDNIVAPELESIDGVNEVSVTGVRDLVVNVTLDIDKLEDEGLTSDSVTSALRSSGVAVPAGDVSEDGESLSIQVGDTFDSVEEIEDLYVTASASTGASNPAAAPGTASAGASAPSGAATRGAGANAPAGVAGAGSAVTANAGPGATGQPATETASARGAAGEVSEPVRLGDVADVEVAMEESSSLTRTNGEPSLGISMTKDGSGNTVDISDEVRAMIPDLETQLGAGSNLTVVSDDAPSVRESIEGLATEGLLGLAFAALVIFAFLLSVRSTLVTAVSIPLSVLVALISLYAWDYSLNILTLGGLTIAIGRVVDDSIVVLENIKRHLEYGEEKRAATVDAVREVAGAVTASTLTTVAVFLPIVFTGSITGELFAPFSVTVTVALLASLLVSLTVVPVLAYWFLKAPSGEQRDLAEIREEAQARERRSPLQRAYVPIIGWAARYRIVTLLAALVLFASSMGLATRLETNFLDNSAQNTSTVEQELPAGSSLRTTDEAAKKVEAVLQEVEGVESYQVTVGSGAITFGPPGAGNGSSGSNSATFSIVTDEDADQAVVEQDIRDRIAEVEGAGTVSLSENTPFSSTNLEVTVQAADEEVLREAAAQVEESVRNTPDTTEVASNLTGGEAEVRVSVDDRAAAEEGLTETQVGQAVSVATQGSNVAQVELDGEQRDVYVRLDSEFGSVEDLRNLEVSTPTGGAVKLDEVTDVERIEGPTQITRIDGERSASITATATNEDTGTVSAEMQQRLDALDLPEGASYSLGGVTADQNESFASLGIALLAAIVLVYIIMVGTFRSIVKPLILMVSVPFAATGAVVLLLLTGTALGVSALIGLLMLVGIVVTNAIVLMDLIQQYRDRGMQTREAVIEGGRRRLRPILMTAVATICALIPMALGLTASSGFISQPLAIVVIGGLTTSTVLTLILVPVLYTIAEDFADNSRKRRERRRARRERRRLEKLEARASRKHAAHTDDAADGATESVSKDEPEGSLEELSHGSANRLEKEPAEKHEGKRDR